MDSDLWSLLCVFNMANLHFYLTCCLLLLTWNLRASVASPVRLRGTRDCGNCATLFKTLLVNVSGLLKNDVLWHGIKNTNTLPLTSPFGTVLACAPNLTKTTRCPTQKNVQFNESECLNNIMKDLAYYKAIISSYITLDLINKEQVIPPLEQTLQIIGNLTEACPFTSSAEASLEQQMSGLWQNNTFSNRQKMSVIMRAFHVRTITFNRAMGYIASGEHHTVPYKDSLH